MGKSVIMETSTKKEPDPSKERSRKCREKKMKDPGKLKEMREKDRLRKKLERQKKKSTITPNLKALEREYERIRKQCQRNQKKTSSNAEVLSHEGTTTVLNDVQDLTATPSTSGAPSSSDTTPYNSKNSLGKAVQRIKRCLPTSPTKQAAVMAEIAKTFTPRKKKMVTDAIVPAKRRLIETTERKKRSDALTEDQINDVTTFFTRDDISRMCPGKKDCITIRTENGKEKRQKRYLIMNMKEAHDLFSQDFEHSVGFSKFCELRPGQVLPISLRDQEVCMCKYHENIELLTHGLRKVLHRMPPTGEELVQITVCSMDTEDCVSRKCDLCSVSDLEYLFEEVDGNTPCPYYQWMKSGETKMIEKTLIQSTLNEVKEDLFKQLTPFSRHVYDSKCQHRELRHLKENLPEGEVIIHEDFSENYSIKQQREIMSAHWASNTVTIFTVMVYYRETAGELKFKSYAIVSDDLSHDKRCVYSFNKWILEDLRITLQHPVTYVHYWSDGAASQFKSRYNFDNILHHEREFGIQADWSYFATAHGKGPIDGIGGEVKRQVWRSVLQGKVVVNNATEFANVASELCKSVTVKFHSSEAIAVDAANLPQRWNSCKGVPGTHELHYVKPVDLHTLAFGRNSTFRKPNTVLSNKYMTAAEHGEQCADDPAIIVDPDQEAEEQYNTGDFILAKMKSDKTVAMYVAQIMEIRDGTFFVSFLRASGHAGNTFVYPVKEDKSVLVSNEIIRKLRTPTMDNRGRYIFDKQIKVTQ